MITLNGGWLGGPNGLYLHILSELFFRAGQSKMEMRSIGRWSRWGHLQPTQGCGPFMFWAIFTNKMSEPNSGGMNEIRKSLGLPKPGANSKFYRLEMIYTD